MISMTPFGTDDKVLGQMKSRAEAQRRRERNGKRSETYISDRIYRMRFKNIRNLTARCAQDAKYAKKNIVTAGH